MEKQRVVEAFFITLNYNISIVGKIWLVLTVFLRVPVLFFAGYPLFQDEEEKFMCNTLQPGCASACYNKFYPVSLFRFWLVQLVSVILVHVLFIVYVIHKLTAILPHPDAQNRMKFMSFYEIKAPRPKSNGKPGVRWRPYSTGAYIFHLLVQVLLEAGFGAAHYYLFGFYIPKHIICQNASCPTMVDCYISTPTEKTIMLNFMLGLAALSLLLNLFDVGFAIQQSVRHRKKKKKKMVMVVQNMYETDQHFNRRRHHQPQPSPRWGEPPIEGFLDDSGAVAECEQTPGQYMLGDVSTDRDLVPTGGDQQRSEWA